MSNDIIETKASINSKTFAGKLRFIKGIFTITYKVLIAPQRKDKDYWNKNDVIKFPYIIVYTEDLSASVSVTPN